MKRLFLLSATALMATMMSAQTAARMDSLKPEQKAMAVSLKLTGELSTDVKGDYRQMRDLCFQVRNIDLSDAQSTIIPKNAFHSRHQLQNISAKGAEDYRHSGFLCLRQIAERHHSCYCRNYRCCSILWMQKHDRAYYRRQS